MENKKVTIIGLGLIGGSLAKALRERAKISDITAISRSIEPINEALSDGTISRGFTEVNEYVWNSDIIFICTPVRHTFRYIDAIAKSIKPQCVVTDVSSTKSEIINYINKMPQPPCFIGGHPMSGIEKAGYSSSFGHLFENAYYILTPSKSTTEAAQTCMIDIIKTIGGIPVTLDAFEHDRITGGISHVPHIIASALVNMVKELDSPDGKMQMLAAGGFKDITRIASSSPEIWESIIQSNKQPIQDIVDVFINILNNFKDYVRNDDTKSIYSFLESARDFRNSFSSNRKGLISPDYEIMVDVVDKPGIIGEIATILGSNSINIKNINVSNSREFEQGCLKITLSDFKSVNIAFDLLCNKSYKVYKSN